MKRKIHAGQTSVTLPLFIQDSSKSDGSGLGSLVYNSAGLACKYRRQGAASSTAVSLVTATLGTFTSGGFIAGDGPTGDYELGIPDLAVAAGARWVTVWISGAASMVPIRLELELDAVDYQDAVRAGLTALPNAAAGATGGVGVLDANGNLPANVQRWLNVVPAAVTATGKFLQTAVQRWLTDDAAGTPAALSAANNVPTNLKEWLGVVPAVLSAPGKYVQAILERWLTDDAAGTPTALANNLVQTDPWGIAVPAAYAEGTAGELLGNLEADVRAGITADHGAGPYGGSGGGGAFSFTLNFHDSNNVPVVGQGFWVKNDAQTAFETGFLRSDQNGQVVLTLDPGNYRVVALTGSVYLPLSPPQFTVPAGNGGSAIVTLTLAPTSGPAPLSVPALLAELRMRIGNPTQDEYNDRQLRPFLMAGLEAANRRVGYHFTTDSASLVLVAGQQEYALPADCVRVVWVEHGASRFLVKTDDDQLRGQNLKDWRKAQGVPVNYFVYGLKLVVQPIPTADAITQWGAAVTLRYVSTPPDISDPASTNTLEQLTTQDQRLPIYWAAADFYASHASPEQAGRSQAMLALFEQEVSRVKAIYEEKAVAR